MQTTQAHTQSPFAPLPKRVAAFAIDLLLLSIPIAIVFSVFGIGFGAFTGSRSSGYPADMSADIVSDTTRTGTMYLLYALVPLFSIAYFSIFESSPKQATPGKMLMGIKVIDEKGEDITLIRGLKRAVVKFFISGIFFIGYLLAFFNTNRQALHDRWSDTFVVDK